MKLNKAVTQVSRIIYKDSDLTIFISRVNGNECKCINYNRITGIVEEEDTVVVNTTAEDLELGTGGYHYVIEIYGKKLESASNDERTIKLNYTPLQFGCSCAETEESEYHNSIENFTSMAGAPVIIGSLHSMLAPVALCLKELYEDKKVAYIMTDGAALPIWISETVRELKRMGILHKTITCGNAFGGDLESVNIYSALIAAHIAAKADITIVCMGPGIIGTGTKYGHRGLEQGQIIDAVNTLGGSAIAIPRISFEDKRERHFGLSHHCITALAEISKTSAYLAIPQDFNECKQNILEQQLSASDIGRKHKINYVNTKDIQKKFESCTGMLNIMGRGYYEDKEYFLTCGAAAKLIERFL